MAAKYNDDSLPDIQYIDKNIVRLVKSKDELDEYFAEDPDGLDEAILFIENHLQNVKTNEEDVVKIELHIEERVKSHDPVDFLCNPNWTILATKVAISELFHFPVEHLYVLYRRSIMKDWMYLKECGVKQKGDVLYVYVYDLNPSKTTKNNPKNARTNLLGVRKKPSHVDRLHSTPSLLNNIPGKSGLDNMDNTLAFDVGDNGFFKPPSPTAVMGKLWTCKNCTFLNEDWRPACCMCSTPKPEQDNSIPAELKPEIVAENFDLNETVVKQDPRKEEKKIGWKCPQCTFVNLPYRPGCEICSGQQPEDYKIPEGYQATADEQELLEREMEVEEAAKRQQSLDRKVNYQRHISVSEQNIITSMEPVECKICFTNTDPQDTIVLQECLHRFCKDCIKGHIMSSEEAVIACPYTDDEYKCEYSITDREIKALLDDEQFQKYLERGLRVAEKSSTNSFHCKTPDCKGWCVYEDQVNTFHCPVCEKRNCLTCKEIHEGMNCKEYQDELARKANTDKAAQETKKLLDKMVKDGDAMNCPQCNIIIQKKIGCDWIRCPMCKVEICWVTKGPRWGPKGRGDLSGGCKCRVGGKRCHKDCGNCH